MAWCHDFESTEDSDQSCDDEDPYRESGFDPTSSKINMSPSAEASYNTGGDQTSFKNKSQYKEDHDQHRENEDRHRKQSLEYIDLTYDDTEPALKPMDTDNDLLQQEHRLAQQAATTNKNGYKNGSKVKGYHEPLLVPGYEPVPRPIENDSVQYKQHLQQQAATIAPQHR